MALRDKDFSIELLFKALADPTRLRLIQLLGDDEVCVCSCVNVLKTHQSKVSRHLAYLRRAGLVTTRRDGKWVYYRVVNPSNPRALKIFTEVRQWLTTSDADS
ncbi:MAG TPA: metalloregulator ArsR/SmtB family transcription factor [Pyrinomonadaceae bacterium]|nr:metalloregulator ArsR/SmtB family transcription factor [Pyrinomonadaceae bacterium]